MGDVPGETTSPRTWSRPGTFDLEKLCIGGGNQYSSFGIDDTHIDAFRIVKGAAEWCSNFTPPSSPHDSEEPSGC